MNLTGSRLSLGLTAITDQLSRVFYGWWIVTACVPILMLVSGIGFSGLGVFLPFLEQEFKASPTLISFGATAFFLMFGLSGPYVGRQIDRVGARLVMVVGSAMFGVGLVGLALSQRVWHTYIAYAVMAAGFGGTSLITVSALIATWFHARRGLAMSLAMNGLSLGGVVMTPVMTKLILAYGWRTAALALATLVWLIGISLSALVIRRRPEDLGLLPDGTAQASVRSAHVNEQLRTQSWTLISALHTRAFWTITIGYLLVNLAQTGVLIHQIRFLTYGTAAEGALSLQLAAFTVSMTSVASICGRLALGIVVDRVDRRWMAVGAITLEAVATIGLLLARGNVGMVYITVLAFGLAMGSVLMLHALLVSDLFGMSSFGAIYGATLSGTTIGLAGGPWLAGFLFDRFGSYDIAFTVFATTGLLAATIIALARPPRVVSEAHRPI